MVAICDSGPLQNHSFWALLVPWPIGVTLLYVLNHLACVIDKLLEMSTYTMAHRDIVTHNLVRPLNLAPCSYHQASGL